MIPLQIGTAVDGDEQFALDGSRFNRHTFWCGQSGSGKTYALGVVLERLLLESGLPLLILDPNSDFVRFHEPRETAPEADAERIRAADIRVFRPKAVEGRSLTVRYIDMDVEARAAVLRLDPIADAEEFNALLQIENEFGRQDISATLEALRATSDPAKRRLLLRMENLGVLNWSVWAHGGVGAENAIDERPDATVLDLGGFDEPEEPIAAALAVLDRLWATREERKPVLIVIDEAHNLCPPDATSPLRRALLERIVQIAAEGRKYGLWLLLSTQRPSKIHPQVLSQCDNLCIMKLNAPLDLHQLAQYFGGVPAELFARSPGFRQGQALFAGGFVAEPSVVQLGERLTVEGGYDVRVPERRAGR